MNRLLRDNPAFKAPARVTINLVNAAIADRGYEIVKGYGYWYFVALPDRQELPVLDDSMVCVVQLNALTLERWVSELDDKIHYTNRYGDTS